MIPPNIRNNKNRPMKVEKPEINIGFRTSLDELIIRINAFIKLNIIAVTKLYKK